MICSILSSREVSLGFMSFFTKAVVSALKEFPDIHSMIDEDQQIKFDFYDISIAVSGPKGLMVPVVRDAQDLTFSGIEPSSSDVIFNGFNPAISASPVLLWPL